MIGNATKLLHECCCAWRPPPDLSVSENAERYRILSPEASAEHGPWRNSRAPHLVEPMDALGPYDEAHRVVCCFSSQTGKTEIILNFCHFIINLNPGPSLVIQPNVSPMGEAFSKDRINPMIRDSKVLREKVAKARSRDSNSTVTHKVFDSGHLTIAGANSPAGLASRPIQYLACDEYARWEIFKEGDPLFVVRKRLQTYRALGRSKELIVSSPTYEDLSIAVEYKACSQQWDFQLECLHCHEYQYPSLKNYRWEEIPGTEDLNVFYTCHHCGFEYTEEHEQAVKKTGKWILKKDISRKTVGFKMNQFASPFASWAGTIQEWIDAGDDPAKQQAVTNTVFCEGWEGAGEKVEVDQLTTRLEEYVAEVPAGVCELFIGIDVQQDRVEAEVFGLGQNWENWSIDYKVVPCEPTAGDLAEVISEIHNEVYSHELGGKIKAAKTCVDSGFYTNHVYQAIQQMKNPNIIPIKGSDGMSRDPIDRDRLKVQRRSLKRMRDGKPAEILGVDSIKLTVYRHLVAPVGKAGHSHFPDGRGKEYFAQLTGERLVPVAPRGKRAYRQWQTIYPHVEALDCRVYAYAAALFFGIENLKPRHAVEPKQSTSGGNDKWQNQTQNKPRKRLIR